MPRKSQLDVAYQYIRDKLVQGQFEPGKKLSRRKLAEEIGVSPALVQHALGQLEKAGLVESRPQSGTYVHKLTAEEFADLCDLRELIEPYAAARAADRVTERQLEVLDVSCRHYHRLAEDVLQTDSPVERWKIHSALIREEQVFHGTILSAVGNAKLTSLIQSLHLLAHVPHNIAMSSVTSARTVALEHDQIREALQANDSELARRRMLAHLQNGRYLLEQKLLEHSGSTSGEPRLVNTK